jgi:hypothetical protein
LVVVADALAIIAVGVATIAATAAPATNTDLSTFRLINISSIGLALSGCRHPVIKSDKDCRK